MNQTFKDEFQQLAPEYAAVLHTMLPDVTDEALEYSLVSMGLITVTLLKQHIERLASGRYPLFIGSRERLGTVLEVHDVTSPAVTRISPAFVWRSLLLLPESSLFRPHALDLLTSSTAPPAGTPPDDHAYQTLQAALTDRPWSDMIRRPAQLIVTALDVLHEGHYGRHQGVMVEAGRRVDLLYPGEPMHFQLTGENPE